MAWQTTAVRYVAIGEQSARFRDITLMFGPDGEPVESVIWLKNGGGKSSLMSLWSAVILPHVRDFTGQGRDNSQKRPRRLDDYVGSGDTSHTVIEWCRDSEPALLTTSTGTVLPNGRRQLLTGAVYEWPERRRPADEKGATLKKLWWSATPLPDLLDLASLVVRDSRLLTLTQFKDRLRNLNTAHPELQIQFAETQSAWDSQLDKLGIDTALFRYQARMNTSEGGIKETFTFNTVKDFIDLVVDVIARPDQAKDCGDAVRSHAANLFRRPQHIAEQTFLGEARELLTQLAAAHELVQTVKVDRAAAEAAAVRLRHALNLAAADHDQASATASGRAATHTDNVTRLRNQRSLVDAVRAELGLLAAQATHTEADRAFKDARATEAADRLDQAAWTVAGHLADAAGYDQVAADLREQLKPERAAREELQARVDTVAHAARTLLEENAESLRRQAAGHGTAIAADREELAAIGAKLGDARHDLSECERAEAAADARLKDHEKAITAARRDKVLNAGESPADALTRTRDAVDALDLVVTTLEEAETTHREEAGAAATRMMEAAAEHTRLAADATTAYGEEQQLKVAHDQLASHDRLVALAEADQQVHLWGDAVRLRNALGDAIRDAEDAALREAVSAADDDRLVAGVDAVGLLPAPVATTHVAAALTSAGISAETCWDVLARDYDNAARSVASARPDIAAAVVVQDEPARERALTVLASDPALTHIALVTAADVAEAATGSSGWAPLPAVPLHAGLHLPDAAVAAAEVLRSHGAARATRQEQLRGRAQTDRAVLAELSEFLIMWPDPNSLTLAATRTSTARNAATRKAQEQAGHDTDRRRHDEAATQARRDLKDAIRTASDLRRHLIRLEQLAAAEEQAAEHRDTIRAAQSALEHTRHLVEQLEERHTRTSGQIRTAELAQAALEREAATKSSEAASIRIIDPDQPPIIDAISEAAAAGLTKVLASYETLSGQWAAESTASVLEAQLASAERSASHARAKAERSIPTDKPGSVEVRTMASERALSHTNSQCETAAVSAQAALEVAIGATANAGTALTQAETALATATTTRARERALSEPVEFTTVDDARARGADLLVQVNDLQAQEAAAAGDAEKASQEAKDEENLAENLRDQGTRIPETLNPDDLHTTQAFPGDLPGARAAVQQSVDRLASTAGELDEASELRRECSNAAVRLVAKPAYTDLTIPLKDRLRSDDAVQLGGRAAEFIAECDTRLKTIADLLVQIGEDEKRVANVVSGHVRQLLTALRAASRASKLPSGLGALSGHQFIDLMFHDPTDEELASRVIQEILAMLTAANGDPHSLSAGDLVLRRCVHAAVGVKGFRVQVLKPNEHQLVQKVDVTDVARFSDGEKLTTCVLLFCAFARMRQQGASRGATGTLMLDNPFGHASSPELVGLQLAVAKAQRVHLVYATGLVDMGALLQFRQIIRLRNRKSLRTAEGHVRYEGDQAGRVGEVAGVAITRPDAPMPAPVRAAVPADAEAAS